MATLRKRGSSWHAQVRRKGYPALTRSFESKADALAWARDKERGIDRADLPSNPRDLKTLTVGDLLRRYGETVTPVKRGAAVESYRLRVLLRSELAAVALDKLTTAAVARYRDERLAQVSPGTVRRELAILQHCFEIARREWDIVLARNPLREIGLPAPGAARVRRVVASEHHKIADALQRSAVWYLGPLITLAIETAMRRGELLSLRWDSIDFDSRTAQLAQTKNGHPRTVPLSPTAIAVLRNIARNVDQRPEHAVAAAAKPSPLHGERLSCD